jgi:hypothetical protein
LVFDVILRAVQHNRTLAPSGSATDRLPASEA